MSQLQDIARTLSAAGAVSLLDGKSVYILYIANGTLVAKRWNGKVFTSAEIIAKSVRAGSSAAYTLTPSAKRVIFVSTDNILRAVRYDDEEGEWAQESFPGLEVHPEGNVYAVATGDTSILAVFQNAGGKLVALNESWATTELPATPVGGSPLTIAFLPSGVHIFYIATDNRVHGVAYIRGGSWQDSVVNPAVLQGSRQPKRILVSAASDESGTSGHDVMMLTKDNNLITISGADGASSVLGKVDRQGKYTAKTDAEGSVYWRSPYIHRFPPPYIGM